MISNYLSLAAAILAFPSVLLVGLSLLIESYGNLSVQPPCFLAKIRNNMADNRRKWNTREFYWRVWGFSFAVIAILLQIVALCIRAWGYQQ